MEERRLVHVWTRKVGASGASSVVSTEWAGRRCRWGLSWLALVLGLKCFREGGYNPDLECSKPVDAGRNSPVQRLTKIGVSAIPM